MMNLAGYRFGETLYQGTRTLVYRGIRDCTTEASLLKTHKPIIIKVLRNPHPHFNELVQFRNQYIIACHLDHANIVQPLALERYGNRYALVMVDEGAIALRDYWQPSPGDLGTFLSIAIQLAEALHYLSQKRIIHKDIKPANILIHPETHQVQLIDFSIASLLPKEQQQLTSPNILEGTLAYISPEQTGRMNRGIDYRTDFYSLGVTLFELLTGELPFNSDNPMELVHCHIAKMPHTLGNGERGTGNRQEIPTTISDIVMKLMAKNAEDRYQSALGLKYDLEKCLHQWKETGKIERFALGERDVCDRFLIPEKLYGRDREVQTLLDAFARVAGGATEIMLVAGFSGIGKTAVVNEVHKPIVQKRGYFIKGKYDQFNRNIPLSAFVQAFRDLMDQLLSESDTDLANWRTKILEVVGQNGQVLMEAIPELERLIGKQPPVPELSGTAAQNRFNLLFGNFIRVFTTQDHPLVIFLDDLQWADAASLNLLKLLMDESDTGYLLVLGAYRDNEVSPAHPLMLSLDDIQKQGATLSTLTLKPLNETDITTLVADTLICSATCALPLTRLVYQKTQGNPFFTTQFLQGLHEDNCIVFIPPSSPGQGESQGGWQCDMAQVRQLALTDDVVEFMVGRLHKLPEATQEVLKLGACVGSRFDLMTLSVVCERSQENVATDLWQALQEGFVVPENETYKFFQGDQNQTQAFKNVVVGYRFLHDRVQQAAYSLIPQSRKQMTHLKIGQLLLKNTTDQEREDNLFRITNQLNIGIPLLQAFSERESLARLNLAAAQKAKSAAAYAAAANYLKTAIALSSGDLPAEGVPAEDVPADNLRRQDPWQSHYALMLQLYNLLVEVSYLNGNFAETTQQIEIVLDNVVDLLDRIKVYEIRIQVAIAQGQCQTALDMGLEILALLDISLKDAPPETIEIDALYRLPTITDRRIIAALNILSKLWAPAFIANPALLPPVILTMLNLSVTYGNSATSAFAYALYGMWLCATTTDIELGYQFGQLALHILEQYEDADLNCKVNQLFHAFIRNWKELARDRIECLAQNVLTGLETGDIEFACYSAINYCDNLCLIGEPLLIVQQKQAHYIELTYSLKQEFQSFAASIWGQFVENLMDRAADAQQLVGQRFDEQTAIALLKESHALTALCFFHIAKTILHYLFNDFEASLNHSASAAQYEQAVGGLFPIAQIPFYRSLALLALYPTAHPEQQGQMLDEVDRHQQRLAVWATHAPENFQHKHDLVAAETARILNQREQAIDLYDRAIAGAKANQYLHEEALANELAAKFYLNWNKAKMAAIYLQEAYYCYAQWGAKAKTRQLERTYLQLLTPILQPAEPRLSPNPPVPSSQALSTVTTTTASLDLAAAIEAARSLSEDIELSALLSNLMHLVLKHAGADRGSLLLNQTGFWEVVAQWSHGSCDLSVHPLDQTDTLPHRIVNTVKRTRQTLSIENLAWDTTFTGDPYLIQQQPKSLLCTPILKQGQLLGLLYLENHLTTGAFTPDRIEVLNLLTAQAAISIENARLYRRLEDYSHTLEDRVEQRTKELQQKNDHLQQTLHRLQQTQTQLVQVEKMSSLGQLVAGIAHEINNPITFIAGNIGHARAYVCELLDLIALYEQEAPLAAAAIRDQLNGMDLDFLCGDLHKLLDSMQTGSDRIRQIVLGLRNFSRLNESGKKAVDLHEGLENTLLILQHRLSTQADSPPELVLQKQHCQYKQPKIAVVKQYGKLPPVYCYASQLNQVFLNILSNAIDALSAPSAGTCPEIRITTDMRDHQTAQIRIADNGPGMSQSICQKVFDPFFTTKPVGQGTGLGLSISYQIVTEQHGGQLHCRSQPGKGTEFAIDLPVFSLV